MLVICAFESGFLVVKLGYDSSAAFTESSYRFDTDCPGLAARGGSANAAQQP